MLSSSSLSCLLPSLPLHTWHPPTFYIIRIPQKCSCRMRRHTADDPRSSQLAPVHTSARTSLSVNTDSHCSAWHTVRTTSPPPTVLLRHFCHPIGKECRNLSSLCWVGEVKITTRLGGGVSLCGNCGCEGRG